ncbi:PQQ-dependent sugar dehydrogenase [Amorphus orientalis]|uniref:Glucose/arabinose dehydrogenase n=1 Tax=Amorphus orientalis TaxID=649198 RepID=A0AAE3VRJ3_9HYPH|nr:PQQ-dependent sugar dehydrogenase [Amorphus orientalis]MDQ0317057.1 glucose/arabinose dehydrogenase [Amorphus orientalis]
MRPLTPSLALVVLMAAAPALAQSGRAPAVSGPPNAPDQQPAFEAQTRAPQPPRDAAVSVETVAQRLPQVWAMELLPDGRMLVTAKSGAMHIVGQNGRAGPPIRGVPQVDSRGQGGLLDVALAPDFDTSNTIFFSFSEPRGNRTNATSVARAQLSTNDQGGGQLSDVEVIFQQTPAYAGTKHFGSRLAFAPDGTLFVTVGERSDTPIRDQAQDLDSGLGKVFRINPDGSIPSDNPFVGNDAAQPAIWSYGHRNLQSATMDDEGRLWTVEHGPRGGDELNQPQPGLNYGWPVITYGINYGGSPVGQGITAQEGMEQPVYYWDPVIAPSGMDYYADGPIEAWRGAFLVGGLQSRGIVILHMEDGQVAYEERLPLQARTRDVKVGPDGAVYAVTEGGGGSSIVRITSSAQAD